MKAFPAILCLSAVARVLAAGAPASRLALNEDNSHFYGSRAASQMTLEGLHAFIDQYADTAVSHLFLCPNAMRTSYASDVWDPIWRATGNATTEKQRSGHRWATNAKLLAARGLDPYAVWIARCRQKGISPWLSMRMNDLHNVDNPENFQHSTFWLEHPACRRVPNATTGSWFLMAFDYGAPAVREYHMKLVRELLERYDPDGLELDWMRFGRHFRPGHEAQSAAILTAFVRRVREHADSQSRKRGRRIKLGARVPTHPDAARGLGMDGVAWAREGLVDMLVPSPFWATSDFDIPLELWREQLGKAADRIVLAAGLEHGLCAYPGAGRVPNTIESVRGFAAACLHRGADWVYLFNYMDPGPIPGGRAVYRELLEKGLALARVTKLPRRHVVTYRDTVPPDFPQTPALPAGGHDKPTFRIYIGPAPKAGRATFVAGLAPKEGHDKATFVVTVNGVSCAAATGPATLNGLPSVARAAQYACPLSALRDGTNEVQVAQPPSEPEQQIIWAELRIAPMAGSSVKAPGRVAPG